MTNSVTLVRALLGALLAAGACPTGAAAPDTTPSSVLATYWRMIPAATFVSRSSGMTYQYANGGCLSVSPNLELTHKLMLPEGATLRYLRTYYRDEGPDALFSSVTRYDAAGALDDYGAMLTPNASGYASMLSPDLAHAFDATGHAYVINVQYRTDDTIFFSGFDAGSARPLLFCGVRVMWDQP